MRGCNYHFLVSQGQNVLPALLLIYANGNISRFNLYQVLSSLMQSLHISFILGEIDYVRLLNRALPKDIRVTGWCPVPVDFSARLFSSSRTQFLLVILHIKSLHLKKQIFYDI